MAAVHCIPFPSASSAPDTSVIERFEIHLLARRGLAQSTVELLVGFIRRALPAIGADPSHDDVETYLARMRLSGAGYANVANAIKALEHYMAFRGDPIHLGRPKRPERTVPAVLTEAEIAVTLAAARTLRERCILAMLAYSGIRNRELCALRIRNIDIAAQTVVVENGKGAKSRTVCIAGSAIKLLVEYMKERNGAPDDYLFLTVRHGYRLAAQDLRKIVRVAAKRAGITRRVWPHLLRHSLATAMLHRGAHPMSIQEQLGHSDISTTMIYLHASKDRLAAEYRMFAPSYL